MTSGRNIGISAIYFVVYLLIFTMCFSKTAEIYNSRMGNKGGGRFQFTRHGRLSAQAVLRNQGRGHEASAARRHCRAKT